MSRHPDTRRPKPRIEAVIFGRPDASSDLAGGMVLSEITEAVANGTRLLALTGPAGAGKTTTAAALELELLGRAAQVKRVRRGMAGDIRLRSMISQLLDKPEENFSINDVEALYQVMVPEAQAQRPVIIIDDAELLQADALAYLSLLSSFAAEQMPQIVFVGDSSFWNQADPAPRGDLRKEISRRWVLAPPEDRIAAAALAAAPVKVPPELSFVRVRRQRRLPVTVCTVIVAGLIGVVGVGAQSPIWHQAERSPRTRPLPSADRSSVELQARPGGSMLRVWNPGGRAPVEPPRELSHTREVPAAAEVTAPDSVQAAARFAKGQRSDQPPNADPSVPLALELPRTGTLGAPAGTPDETRGAVSDGAVSAASAAPAQAGTSASPAVQAAPPVWPPELSSAAQPSELARSTATARAETTPSAGRGTGVPSTQVTLLLSRAVDMLALSDISAARLLYRRAAALGSAQAATALGQTYDPAYLAATKATGIQPDAAAAAAWYNRGAALGDHEAANRLASLGPVP